MMDPTIDLAILDFSKAFDTVPHQRRYVRGTQFLWDKGIITKLDSSIFEGQTPTCGRRGDDIGSGTSRLWGTAWLSVGTTTVSFISDLPNVVTSQVRLFADDCLLYRPIRSVVDQEAFQCDMDALELGG